MKHVFWSLLLLMLTFGLSAHGEGKYTNPLPVKFGDPYVLLASDGRYYMYGTGAGAVDGFCVYSSDNLIDWKAEGQVYRGNVPGSWAVTNFWAPEVYERNGKYYMFSVQTGKKIRRMSWRISG